MVGRRDDGHHLLDSQFVLLDLADRLLLAPGSSGLRVDGEMAAGVPPGADNLAWRGLVAGLGAEPGLTWLALEKRVPAAAGLGVVRRTRPRPGAWDGRGSACPTRREGPTW